MYVTNDAQVAHTTGNASGSQNYDVDVCPNTHFNSLRSFNAFPKNFNFFHVNVQGLLDASHFEQLKNLLFKCRNIGLIAASRICAHRIQMDLFRWMDIYHIICIFELIVIGRGEIDVEEVALHCIYIA